MNVIEFVLHDPKAALAVIASAILNKMGAAIDLIPDDIGKVVMLANIALAVVLAITHWRKGKAETQKLNLEIKILRQQVNDK